MYWSYLAKSREIGVKNLSAKLLTFETNNNFENLSTGYCKLIIDDYFSCFGNDYDCIFISEYNPTQNPSNMEIKFLLNFNDVERAKKLLDE